MSFKLGQEVYVSDASGDRVIRAIVAQVDGEVWIKLAVYDDQTKRRVDAASGRAEKDVHGRPYGSPGSSLFGATRDPRWEYVSMRVSWRDIDLRANQASADGWELLSVVYAGERELRELTFKRRLP